MITIILHVSVIVLNAVAIEFILLTVLMRSVIRYGVAVQSVGMMSVIMLNVAEPFYSCHFLRREKFQRLHKRR
jgi:hypothetical protein